MAVYRYKKLIINRNALVAKGAMGVKPVLKEDGSFVATTQLYKLDDDKMELSTILVTYNKMDKQDMILDDEKVRDEAIIEFLKDGDKSLKIMHNTDESDSENYVEASLKEGYIVQKGDNDFPDYEGSIKAVYKFSNESDWSIVKALELQTSIEGWGELEEIDDVELAKESDSGNLKNFFKKYYEQLSKFFGKEKLDAVIKGEEMPNEETQAFVSFEKQEDAEKWALKSVVEDVAKMKAVVETIIANLDKEDYAELSEMIKDVQKETVANLETEKGDLEKKLEELEKKFNEQETLAGNTMQIDVNKVKLF